MKLIVGLGNPGKEYEDTRHNLGYRVVERLSRDTGICFRKEKYYHSFIARGEICGQETILSLPLTFMNLCGNAVEAILKDKDIAKKDTIVVCDDINLGLGGIRIRPCGSSGGHKGLASVIAALGAQDFPRLRLGIRPQEWPLRKGPLDKYVLSPWSNSQRRQLNLAIEKGKDCLRQWLTTDIDKVMSKFNTKEQRQ
ncbi:MAG: aminoacyl-tRNA hydrolase [Candidatus Omnitrophota bacterium]